eukprot:m.158471 g.158471  ORF g.158471 m.158471 type:complete len:370 (+) comp15137_c0_seq4:3567-4676(+)
MIRFVVVAVLLPCLMCHGSADNNLKCTLNTTAMDVVQGVDLMGSVVVMTGGDSGIGYENAMALASAGATLVLLSYDAKGSGASAAANITKATGNKDISVIGIDLSSFQSVRAAAENILSAVDKIDVVICDAGLGHNPSGLNPITADGYERLWEVTRTNYHFLVQFYFAQVNLLGHVLLSDLLLPSVRKTQGRFVMVSSDAALDPCSWGNLPNDCTDVKNIPVYAHKSPNGTNPEGVWATNYALGKYVEIFWTAELARRETANNTGIIAVSLDPGFVNTSMSQGMNPAIVKKWCQGQKPCPLTPQEGATTQTFLAVEDKKDLIKNNGGFFEVCEPNLSNNVIEKMKQAKGEDEVLAYQKAIYEMLTKMIY